MSDQKEPCGKCGQVHRGCTAHRKHEPDVPCGNHASRGLTVCRYHGGSNKAAKAKARRVLAERAVEADARRLLATYGESGVGDPLEGLERIVAQNLGLVAAAGARLNAAGDLNHEDLKGGLHTKSEIGIYERALDRAMKGMALLIQYRPDAQTEATRSLLSSMADALQRADVEDLEPDEDDLL